MHPEVKKLYEQNDFDLPLKSANDENLQAFWDKVAESKEPVNKEIYKIVRLKHKGQEYFYYHIRYTSRDVLKNKIQAMEPDKGYYDKPEFRHDVDPQTRKLRSTEIESTERIYELKWPVDFTEELQNLVTDTVDLLVIGIGRKYGGFSFDDFLDRSFDDLVTFGRFGTFNLAVINEVKKRNASKT
jgi:hypothetical protein